MILRGFGTMLIAEAVEQARRTMGNRAMAALIKVRPLASALP